MRNFRAMTVTFCENIAVFFESFVSYRDWNVSQKLRVKSQDFSIFRKSKAFN